TSFECFSDLRVCIDDRPYSATPVSTLFDSFEAASGRNLDGLSVSLERKVEPYERVHDNHLHLVERSLSRQCPAVKLHLSEAGFLAADLSMWANRFRS